MWATIILRILHSVNVIITIYIIIIQYKKNCKVQILELEIHDQRLDIYVIIIFVGNKVEQKKTYYIAFDKQVRNTWTYYTE